MDDCNPPILISPSYLAYSLFLLLLHCLFFFLNPFQKWPQYNGCVIGTSIRFVVSVCFSGYAILNSTCSFMCEISEFLMFWHIRLHEGSIDNGHLRFSFESRPTRITLDLSVCYNTATNERIFLYEHFCLFMYTRSLKSLNFKYFQLFL